ncbi:MAG TPA: ABC transporter permease subunit [Chloroflexota bacterium]
MALRQPAIARVGEPLPALPRWRRHLLGYALAAPAVALVLGMFAYPLVYELQLSLTDATAVSPTSDFVGLGNYAQILTDPHFWEATRNTAFLVVVTASAQVVLGMAVALLLWRGSWLRWLLFVTVFLPWIYPSGFATYTWYWIILPPFHTFYTLQVIQARFWLEGLFGEQAWHMLSFVLVGAWRGSSIVALVLVAGFRTIPRDLLDYGRLETSNALRYTWSVVLPLARRFVALGVVVAVTGAYLGFLAMYIESNGRITTPVLGTLVYRAELMDGRTGYAAALSLVQIPVVVVLVLVALPLIESRVSRRRIPDGVAAQWPLSRLAGGGSRHFTAARSARGAPGSHIARRLVGSVAGALACAILSVFYVFPLYYTAVQSLKSQQDFIKGPLGQPFWAYRIDISDGWIDTLTDPVFWHAASNTAVIFSSVTVVAVVVALLAAYGLARLRPPGADWLARLLFAAYFVPQLALIVPLLQVYANLGLDNTLLGLVLLYLTLAIPFATWLFYIYFQALDSEVEDHARLDASRPRVFVSVVLPRAWPVITAAALFGVGMMTADLLYAKVFMLSSATRTLPVTMGSMVYDPDRWADANAAVLLGALPILLCGLLLGGVFVRGLQSAFSDQ